MRADRKTRYHHRGHATEAGSLRDRCVSKGAIFNLERVSGYNFVPCGPRVPGSENQCGSNGRGHCLQDGERGRTWKMQFVCWRVR